MSDDLGSSSNYSDSSDDPDAAPAKKRPTLPSRGCTDRRRLAIVQIEEAFRPSDTLRARRGLSSQLAGLALVAPPDASCDIYTQLTPPSTARVEHRQTTQGHQPVASAHAQHSARDTQPTTRPSAMLSPRHPSAFSPPLVTTPEIGASKEIHVPVAAPVVVNLTSGHAVQTRPPRSNIAATATASPFPPKHTSGFVHYQPGLDAMAGPLPPPPRLFDVSLHTPPPPRPPRLHSPAPPKLRAELEAVKLALQLPPSVAAKLAKTPPPADVQPLAPSKREYHGDVILPPHKGALVPDLRSSTSSTSTDNSESQSRPPFTEDDDRVTIEQARASMPTEITEELMGETSTSSSSLSRLVDTDGSSSSEVLSLRQQTPSPEGSKRGISLRDSPNSLSRSNSLSPRSSALAPSPPPKSFRHSLTTGLKRFSSLPRAPSLSRSKRSSSGTHHSSRTPSPSIATRRVRRKIVDYNPPAMFCHEVYQQRTTAERCAIYVAKINELYIYDCGLSDWVVEMQYRTSNPPPRGPSSQRFVPQPRHTSRSSMISELTFPRRPDASTATDLSSQSSSYHEGSPISVPVSLPYPSLANQQRQQSIRSSTTSVASATPASSIRSLGPSLVTPSKTGFFASLGRKASLSTSRRERGGLSLNPAASTASRNTLSKHLPSAKDISKPIMISTSHSGPNGPRALTSSMRIQRSKTLMTPVSPGRPMERDEVLGRRPSLFNIDAVLETGRCHDPEFDAQVDRLQNLLPHADRTILAGYLNRAGQDVLAIGQYLEDEKNGTLKFF